MFARNLLMALLVVVVIGAPIVYHEMESPSSNSAMDETGNQLGSNQLAAVPAFDSTPPQRSDRTTRNASRAQVAPMESPFQLAGYPNQLGGPAFDRLENPAEFHREPPALNQPALNMVPIRAAANPNQVVSPSYQAGPAASMPPNPIAPSQPAQTPYPVPTSPTPTTTPPAGSIPTTDFAGMVADYGAAETYIFPGNEHGPDLTAEPLENLPVQNFGEIFRFDLTKAWVQSRWRRVSTNPIDYSSGLTGLRVPLVTGTNTWDLHGSLTYFFDNQQKLQRITFRGWTGNPENLVQLLTQEFQFESQPTNLEGFYLASSWRKKMSGLLMKSPPVIDAGNPYQRFGLVLEINNPQGSYELSEDFRRLIAGSHPE